VAKRRKSLLQSRELTSRSEGSRKRRVYIIAIPVQKILLNGIEVDMTLEEFIESVTGRKLKPRKIVDLEIEEITLCGSAANRKSFYITKGNRMSEVIELIKQFLETEIEKLEVGETEIKRAVETLLIHKPELPDDIEQAIGVLMKSMVQRSGHLAEKSQADDFPSIPICGPAHLISKMIPDSDDDENDDEDSPLDEWG